MLWIYVVNNKGIYCGLATCPILRVHIVEINTYLVDYVTHIVKNVPYCVYILCITRQILWRTCPILWVYTVNCITYIVNYLSYIIVGMYITRPKIHPADYIFVYTVNLV